MSFLKLPIFNKHFDQTKIIYIFVFQNISAVQILHFTRATRATLQPNKPEPELTNDPAALRQRNADPQNTNKRSRWISRADNPSEISDPRRLSPEEKDPLTDPRSDVARVHLRNSDGLDQAQV